MKGRRRKRRTGARPGESAICRRQRAPPKPRLLPARRLLKPKPFSKRPEEAGTTSRQTAPTRRRPRKKTTSSLSRVAMPLRHFASVLLTMLVAAALRAADEPAGFPWLDPDGVRGALLVCGGAEPAQTILDKFSELAGGNESRIIVVRGTDASSPILQDALPGAILECGPWDEQQREI